MHWIRPLLAAAVLAVCAAAGLAPSTGALAAPKAGTAKVPEVRFTDYRLENGLRVILSVDKSAPVVAVSVTYNVGSRNERPGRTGFAHLFEHMLFQGSQNVGKGEHMLLIQNNGGTMNGTTSADRTNYFQALPANQLELALFLEADRMRSLDLSQANLDNQRAVVQEERRQSYDNQPYGWMSEAMDDLLYTSFAYRHSTIGSMEDLNAATLDDVREFFKTYYAPNNAALAVVGDFDEARAKKLIRKYFGDIPRGPQPPPVDVTEKPLTEEKRVVRIDPLARLTRYESGYKTVPADHPDAEALQLLGAILSSGRTGRLYPIQEKRLALQASARHFSGRGPGTFSFSATLPPGASLESLEAAFDAEIARIQSEGVSEAELNKARAQARARLLVGGGRGFGGGLQTALGRANALSQNAIYWNDPGRFNTALQRLEAVTPVDVKRAAETYLRKQNRVVVVANPGAESAPAARPRQGGDQPDSQ